MRKIIFVLILLFSGLLYAKEKVQILDVSNWLGRLDDSTPINKISIPGTHDSATQFSTLSYFSKCQKESIKTQLDFGYRYLDIRLAVDDKNPEKLKFVHGFTNCKTKRFFGRNLYLDDVLSGCYDFLKSHPTETIVFVAKQDYGDIEIAEFQKMLNRYIEADSKFWFTENRIPSLGEVRGKLVLARRFENEAGLRNAGLNLVWAEQNNRNIAAVGYVKEPQKNELELVVQDRFKYNAKDKWTAFLHGIEAAENDADRTAVHVSFLSTNGNVKFGHPAKYARKLNKWFCAENFDDVKFYGWVIVDYGTENIAAKVIGKNFE